MDMSTCGRCWEGKHKCKQSEVGRCRACIKYLVTRQITTQRSIPHSPYFYNAAISQELFKDHQAGSLSSLDTDGLSRNALSMRIFMSTGRVIDTSYSISGPFTIQNKAVVAWLDGLAGQFAADLKAKEGDCELISEAALIGGYQFLLCSMVGVTEHAENFLDGSPIPSEYTGLNLEAHFKNIVVCRLRELMNKNLDAIRTENSDDEYRNSNAYAAAVTARTETHYFKCNIRNGSFRDNVSAGVKDCLLRWFQSVDLELTDRIAERCGRYTLSSAIEGSLKKLRRKGVTLNIAMHIQLNKVTMPLLSYDPSFSNYPHTTVGNPEATLPTMDLISRPSSVNAGRLFCPAVKYSTPEILNHGFVEPFTEYDSVPWFEPFSMFGNDDFGLHSFISEDDTLQKLDDDLGPDKIMPERDSPPDFQLLSPDFDKDVVLSLSMLENPSWQELQPFPTINDVDPPPNIHMSENNPLQELQKVSLSVDFGFSDFEHPLEHYSQLGLQAYPLPQHNSDHDMSMLESGSQQLPQPSTAFPGYGFHHSKLPPEHSSLQGLSWSLVSGDNDFGLYAPIKKSPPSLHRFSPLVDHEFNISAPPPENSSPQGLQMSSAHSDKSGHMPLPCPGLRLHSPNPRGHGGMDYLDPEHLLSSEACSYPGHCPTKDGL